MKGFSQLAENGDTDQFHAGYRASVNISQSYILKRKESGGNPIAGSRILERKYLNTPQTLTHEHD